METAPSAFQRTMDMILVGCKATLSYLDDILITAQDKMTLRERVEIVRDKLKDTNVAINEEKSMDEGESVEWLGYELSAKGIQPSAAKTLIIQNLQVPTTTKEVRKLLDVINYYRRFGPKIGEIAIPIQEPLQKNKDVKNGWNQRCSDALDEIKTSIGKRDTLAPFNTDGTKKVVLYCDASNEGMGAVLEQEQMDGKMQPVLYWFSQFRKYEKNYSISEKEALACVAAMWKLKKYLLGRKFTLKTDHMALVTLVSQQKTSRSTPGSKGGERRCPSTTMMCSSSGELIMRWLFGCLEVPTGLITWRNR